MEKVYRVFFHELGHFIGRLINHRKYGGPDVKEVKIFPCRKRPDEYCGYTGPVVPPGVDRSKPLVMVNERVPSYLVSVPYGCFVQGYYTEKSFISCFKENGEDDEDGFNGRLRIQGSKLRHEDFKIINYKFFDGLIATRALDALMKLDPDDYLQEESNGKYGVDIDKLKVDIEPFLESHTPVYAQLVEQYQALIKSDN